MLGRRAGLRTRLLARLGAMVAIVTWSAGAFTASGASGAPIGSGNGIHYSRVAQAAPDECWVPPADPSNPADYGQYVNPVGHDSAGGVVCPAGAQPKVNQAYVWGMTQVKGHIFFGTAPNVLCLVLGTYLGDTRPMVVSGSWTCEFGSSPTANLGVPAGIGDWRPPQLASYDLATKSVVNLVATQTPTAQAALQGLLSHTLGIRSAGEAVNPLNPSQTVAFLAGPSLSTTGGLNVFAFDQTGIFLGATTLAGYDDIRNWLTVPADTTGGQRLYAGVDVTNAGHPYGAILKWAPTATNLFNFTVAGTTSSDVAYLAAAGDRIYADTWPNPGHNAGLYVSPVSPVRSPDGGLNGGPWTELWQSGNYEPDPVTAATYGGGAMAVYGGYVYWGTMHVPFVAAEAHIKPGQSTAQALADIVGAQRSISVFRLKVGSSSPQLLYGDARLPAYLPTPSNPSTSSWQLVPNNMGGVSGLYGPSGFGNPFNNYTWSMSVYNGQLYVGTMDWSYLLAKGWPQLTAAFGLPPNLPNPFVLLAPGYGADLFRFPSPNARAQVASIDGVGNPLNYGVRNMVSVQDRRGSENGLYLGMANPMNLATSSPNPGGWEIIRVTAGGDR